MTQIITNDKSILVRINKYSKLDMGDPQAPTPKRCPVCQEKMFPRLIHRRIIYIGCACRNARTYKFTKIK